MYLVGNVKNINNTPPISQPTKTNMVMFSFINPPTRRAPNIIPTYIYPHSSFPFPFPNQGAWAWACKACPS